MSVFALLIWLLAPGFTVAATYLNPDIPEAFFASGAFWTLLATQRRPQSTRLWLLLGVLAGLGFLNRQTAAAFVLFAVLVFALRPGAPRRRYFVAGAAFLAVFGAQWPCLTLMTGNPLYRESLDFNHGVVDRVGDAAAVAAQGRWIDDEGNLSLSASTCSRLCH